MDEERLTVDAYVVHFLTKSVHTILTARLPNPTVSHIAPTDKWFNFPIKEVEGAKSTLRQWKDTPHTPILIKILYRSLEADRDDRVLVEVWKLEYDTVPAQPLYASLSYQDDACTLYKNLIVLMRVLYTFLRTLPVHELYRRAMNEEAADFTLEFELEVGGEGAVALSASSEWKEVVATDTSGGRVAIHVAEQEVSELRHHLAKSHSVSSPITDDWVMFVRKTETGTPPEVFNPVTAHFRVGFESMRSAMTTLMNPARTFQKTRSFPQSRRAVHKADTSQEEEEIYIFLAQLRASKWPERADDHNASDSVSVSQGRALLLMYKQKRTMSDSGL